VPRVQARPRKVEGIAHLEVQPQGGRIGWPRAGRARYGHATTRPNTNLLSGPRSRRRSRSPADAASRNCDRAVADLHNSRARRRGDRMNVAKRECITLLGSAVSVFLCVSAAAQEGYYGVGHDKWHQGFYSTLKRNDGGGSCCNLMDCRPTQSRIVGDHYEVKVDGVWTPWPAPGLDDAWLSESCLPLELHRA
jgi:hypothetical protein